MVRCLVPAVGGCWVDLMCDEAGYWIEDVAPDMTRVSRHYDTEAAAVIAWEIDDVDWEST